MADLLRAIRRHMGAFLAVALPCALVAIFMLEQLPDEYTSTAVVTVAPRDETNVQADVVRLLMPKYQVYATSRASIERATQETDLSFREIRDALAVEVPTDTGLLEVSVTATDPVTAAKAVSAIAAETVALADGDALVTTEVLIPADVSSTPSGPPRRLSQVVALLVALGAGALAANLLERRAPRVRTLADVREAVEVPIFGSIARSPHIGERPSRLLLIDPTVATNVGVVSANLRKFMRRERLRSVAITSARAGEGKSTLAALLALSSAPHGRVLLIDGDLQHPMLAERLGEDEKAGLAAVLEGAPLSETVIPQSVEGFDFLAHDGSWPASTVEGGMRRLVREAAYLYDLVIVDVPPVLDGHLGRILAAACDGVVLVTRGGVERRDLEQAVDSLDILDVWVLGIVANAMGGDPTRPY